MEDLQFVTDGTMGVDPVEDRNVCNDHTNEIAGAAEFRALDMEPEFL
jgi:hypothetical protein